MLTPTTKEPKICHAVATTSAFNLKLCMHKKRLNTIFTTKHCTFIIFGVKVVTLVYFHRVEARAVYCQPLQ